MEKWTWNNAQAEQSDNLLEILFSVHNKKTRYFLIRKLIRVSLQYKKDHPDVKAINRARINQERRQKLIDAGIIRIPKRQHRRVLN